MGTHPIFESDFDCLTELKKQIGKGKWKSKLNKMKKFLRDNGVKREANLKLNLKPSGIQAVARSKLKLKRPAEDDAEREKKYKRRPVLTAKLRLNDQHIREHEEKHKEESQKELIEDFESQNEEDMEDTIEKSLPVEEQTNSRGRSRYNVCQIKNLRLNRTIEDTRSSKNGTSWKRMKFKEVSKDKVSLCNRLLYEKQIVIEKELVKEEDITLTIISTRKEFDWSIVRTQFVDIAVKLQDSHDLQIGGIITVTVPTNRKLRDLIFITDPKKLKLENDFHSVTNGVTPVQVSNRFQAGCSDS